MRDFSGSVAFITGGASGVGLGQAKLFAQAGCKVVIADVRQQAIEEALSWFGEQGLPAHGIALDITDREAYVRAADETERVFGTPRLLFNTAGVSMFGPLEKASYEDYDWHMNVNFGGVVNGIQTFVPRMIAAGRGGHIVNTASAAAFRGSDRAGIYSASKFAVLGLTESLRHALEKYDIGVSVLCPANVNTNIAESVNTRPAHLANSGWAFNDDTLNTLKTVYSFGMDPVELAGHVRKAIEDNQLYIIPYPEMREELERHFARILDSIPPMNSDEQGVATRRRALEAFRTAQDAQIEATGG